MDHISLLPGDYDAIEVDAGAGAVGGAGEGVEPSKVERVKNEARVDLPDLTCVKLFAVSKCF